MARPHVFVTRNLPAEGLDRIAQECEMDVWTEKLPPSPEVLLERSRGCVGLVTLLTDTIDASVLSELSHLKVISNFAVGVNNIDLAAATKHKVPVGNTPGVLTDATADLAVALLLATARRVHESSTDAQAGRWQTWEPLGWLGQDLTGKTLGIVGMGRIGFATAKRLHHGWNMNVLYTAREAKPEAERDLQARQVDLDTLLRDSDFISLHADLNDSTRGMIGPDAIAKMKPTAVLVNTARGPLVDQAALAQALREQRIFAAGLDVTDPEPLPSDHELFHLPNCLIVPHIASATVETRNAMARMCAENLLAGGKGEPLPYCVNPEVYSAGS